MARCKSRNRGRVPEEALKCAGGGFARPTKRATSFASGHAIITQLFFLVIAACALTSPWVLGASFSTVVIDAGHGGHDRGGIPSNIIPEKAWPGRRPPTPGESGGSRTPHRHDEVLRQIRLSGSQGQHRECPKTRDLCEYPLQFRPACRRERNRTFYGSAKAKRLARLIQRNAMRTTSGENRGIKEQGITCLENRGCRQF